MASNERKVDFFWILSILTAKLKNKLKVFSLSLQVSRQKATQRVLLQPYPGMDRTHSIMRIATTASPVSGANVREKMVDLETKKSLVRVKAGTVGRDAVFLALSNDVFL